MAIVVAELVAELKTLRKGRGLYVGPIGERVGPVLSQICGRVPDDGPAEVRKKVGGRLEGLAGELPEDLRLAVLVAFAIHRDARQPFYQDRVRWYAHQLRRDERTARRRIDEAIERVAELAATPGTGRGAGPAAADLPRWHTEELRVAVLVDRPALEALEIRRVVADQDGLDELDLALTLGLPPGSTHPADPRDLWVEVLYGGTLAPRTREALDRFGYVLELPAPLERFGKHEFALRYRAGGARPVRPYFACVLKQRCDVFDLRVRFDRENPPRLVRRLSGAFHHDLEDPVPRGEILTPDRAGELHVTFAHPTPGLVYGVRWD